MTTLPTNTTDLFTIVAAVIDLQTRVTSIDGINITLGATSELTAIDKKLSGLKTTINQVTLDFNQAISSLQSTLSSLQTQVQQRIVSSS